MSENKKIAFVLLGVGILLVVLSSILSEGEGVTIRVKESTATITTQPMKFIGKVTEVLNPDGVPLVRVMAMNEDLLGHKELAIATTNFVVGDVIRIVTVTAPGGKYFPVAMPVAVTNSWP